MLLIDPLTTKSNSQANITVTLTKADHIDKLCCYFKRSIQNSLFAAALMSSFNP